MVHEEHDGNVNERVQEASSFIDQLVKDRETLTNWVLGFVDGCEGCIEEATAWASSVPCN